MGKLVSLPSSTTFEMAENEFKNALDILKKDVSKDGTLRYAACCEIYEIADKLPILFAVYLMDYLEYMWNILKDSKEYIRDVALMALRQALNQF